MEGPDSCKFRCRRLAGLWQGYWPAAHAAALTADVEARLAAATAAWGLSGVEPLDGGAVALTCAAARGGRPVVLKLNPRGHRDDAQLGAEGDALDFWGPTGAAAELLARRDGGFTLLLERLAPGHPLDDAGLPHEDRLAELGRLAGRLHAAGAPPAGSFVGLRDFAPEWELPEGGEEVLAHLDLHGGNALRAGDGWKAIDPKGVRADRHADVWALIDPVSLRLLPEEPERAREAAEGWIEVYAGAAGLDPGKARTWTRVRALAELREGDESAALRRLAEALGRPDRR